MRKLRLLGTIFAGASLSLVATAALAGEMTLVTDLPAGQLPGTSITFSVDGQPANSTLRLQTARLGEPLGMVYDFTSGTELRWTPMNDGAHSILVTVREADGTSTQLNRRFFVSAAPSPVVRPTRHPLVAVYNTPACAAGLSMRVSFRDAAGGNVTSTDTRACNGVDSMNFFIAGMTPETQYIVRHLLVSPVGNVVAQGPVRAITTGAVPAELTPPVATVRVPPTGDASLDDDTLLISGTAGSGTWAYNLEGELIWYYDSGNTGETTITYTRSNPGGTHMIIGAATAGDRFRMREVDQVGNVVKETNARRLSEQWVANGGEVPFTTIHHEARKLPTGQYLVLGHSEVIRMQGGEEVNVLSDTIVALDENLQIIWQWDAFDHMDIERLAILGEVCASNGAGCPQLLLSEEANDWLHSNAIGYRESDGAIILSIRHQDWSVAIDYADGTGSGNVLWRLGNEGDFSLAQGVDPDLWQSHQHDNNFIDDDKVLLYDNGNALSFCVADQAACISRGQLYQLDETTMEATLLHSFVLPRYSFAVGSAQPLQNGNFHFNSGIIDFSFGYSDELNAAGAVVFSMEINVPTYRTVRMPDLYTPPVYSLD